MRSAATRMRISGLTCLWHWIVQIFSAWVISEPILREQKELRARINSLEIKLSSKEVQIHNIENKMKNNSLENEFKFQAIDEKIDKLNKKDEEIMEKIEKLEVKTSDMDIFSLFKDSGDGNIDITKVLVKSLEEKVFRKFDLIDEKYKRDAANNMKLKTNVENIFNLMKKLIYPKKKMSKK